MTEELCKNCWRYKSFKDKCHYFWKEKLECSMFMNDEFSEPKYSSRLE